MADDAVPNLGELERAVMQLVWAHAPVTVDDVRKGLKRGLKEVTVRTVLRRLESKGFVTHTTEGRTFLYSAAEPRERVTARAVKRVVDWFNGGSLGDVLVGMVDSAMLDKRELDELADSIAAARKRRK